MNKSKLPCFIILLFAMCYSTAQAQKLPNIQQISLRAPDNIKIDGKATEWGNKFQAYNSATEIYYTVSNDDKNLYLAIQAVEPDIITKIFTGGITLTIQPSAKKDDKNKVQITYPITKSLRFNLNNRRGIVQDTSARYTDSVMNHNNKILDQNCKSIQVTGVEGLDTLISVYNTDGVNAAGLFNNKKAYTLELAVSLKHLGFWVNDKTKFTYHIRINGKKMAFITAETTIVVGGGTISNAEMASSIATANARIMRTTAPTDFSAEYTLAKKP